MADADFWRDLAERFRKLSNEPDAWVMLWAKPNADEKWVVQGSYSYTARFNVLASLAAKEFGHSVNLVDAWLRALVAEDPDSLMDRKQQGDILRIAHASADFCETLAYRALEPEGISFKDVRSVQEPTSAPIVQVAIRPFSRSIHNPMAAQRMKDFMESHGLTQPAFAEMAGTTERTIRSFGNTGKVRKSILGDIASAMGTTLEDILKA